MKSIFTFLLLLVLTLNFGCKETDTNPIKVKLNLKKEYTKTLSTNDPWVRDQIEQQSLNVSTDSVVVHYYDIKIEIENTGQSDIYVWLMTCSWHDNFRINNNYIYFYHWGCDSNFPGRKKIAPKSKITLNGTVRKNLKFDYPDENSIYGEQVELTKVGLITIDDINKPNNVTLDYIPNIEDKSKYKLIWSNGIKLLSENEQNQEDFN
ncbi:hypothetical protein [Chryseobacterium caseinilyticum]|uniref:Lipoprotein n=1 Tax=Chryseobacterium caseinilyticum TaxID=2771428 RepID=A0ABR8Z9I6_9FLAO|nr:hypothetical protein [Chryseobacterium caseinilyticum]MBD8081885.1 hypothetical protein [Chryseobacterium caseinilyticum]